jgi:hypothetical protein
MRLNLRLDSCRHAPLMRILSAIDKESVADHLVDLAALGAIHAYKISEYISADVQPKQTVLESNSALAVVEDPATAMDVAGEATQPPSVRDQAGKMGMSMSLVKTFMNPKTS